MVTFDWKSATMNGTKGESVMAPSESTMELPDPKRMMDFFWKRFVKVERWMKICPLDAEAKISALYVPLTSVITEFWMINIPLGEVWIFPTLPYDDWKTHESTKNKDDVMTFRIGAVKELMLVNTVLKIEKFQEDLTVIKLFAPESTKFSNRQLDIATKDKWLVGIILMMDVINISFVEEKLHLENEILLLPEPKIATARTPVDFDKIKLQSLKIASLGYFWAKKYPTDVETLTKDTLLK
jgi:hypothetical protein